MKVTYDETADAMYVYLENIKPGTIKQTISLNDDIIIDFDANNKIVGIEILDASKNLKAQTLKKAVATV